MRQRRPRPMVGRWTSPPSALGRRDEDRPPVRPSTGARRHSFARLLAHTLERVAVLLLVHEATVSGIALGPGVVLRVEDLRAVAHSAAARVVTDGGVLGHWEVRSDFDVVSPARQAVAGQVFD